MSAAPTRQPLNCNFVAHSRFWLWKRQKTAVFFRHFIATKQRKSRESRDLSTESAGDVGPHRLGFALDHVDAGLH
jgi:hypothetical protein